MSRTFSCALDRDAKSHRDLLESYLAKYREAMARDNLGAASPDARVISTALVTNTPSWPKKLPTVLVAALGMLALSVGFVLTGEVLGGAAMGPLGELPPMPVPPEGVPALRERAPAVATLSHAARTSITYSPSDPRSARIGEEPRSCSTAVKEVPLRDWPCRIENQIST